MRRISWRGEALELYSRLIRLLNWSVTLSLFNLCPAFKQPAPTVSCARRKEAFAKQEEAAESDARDEKRAFLGRFGDVYGYPGSSLSIDKLRATEFARLNGGVVYVDHAGATLHADSQLKAALKDLSSNLYGNPHSQSDSSVRTSNAVESARQQVLDYCNAPAGEYTCVFTSGATAALKLVGETFPWSDESEYMYTLENHNSVLGIREYALDQGVMVTAVEVEAARTDVSNPEGDFSFMHRLPQKRASATAHRTKDCADEVLNLFAFPLECNFSGAKFDLNLIKHVQSGRHVSSPRRGRWMVLLDAAKGCGTAPPDLTLFPADFVAISFYKIFGYPTGLGALLVRTDAARLLRKKYFGGGTVAMSIADADMMQKRDRVEQWLEDGTATFLGIAALRHGFAAIARLHISNINIHTGALTNYLASRLASLKHGTGASVCVLHGHHGFDQVKYWGPGCNQGPVVTFNLKRADGSWVGHREVEKLSAFSNIQLRTGCFCNPGACAKYLGLSQHELLSNFEAGHVCWDDQDVINGRPTGAVRVSVGYMSTFEDCWAITKFIVKYFVETGGETRMDGVQKRSCTSNAISSTESERSNIGLESSNTSSDNTVGPDPASPVRVESIVVYPIKSCGGFSADVWPLSNCGLLYDREWMIKSAAGDVLTQKKLPSMCSIQISIDLAGETMHVRAPNMPRELAVPLRQNPECPVIDGVKLCGNRVEGNSYGVETESWFTEALGVPCTLVRRDSKTLPLHFQRGRPTSLPLGENDDGAHEVSFANEGQFLLVSKASVDELNQRVAAELGEDCQSQESCSSEHDPSFTSVDSLRFRPNIVVAGAVANDEDNWESINICSQNFRVLGGCNRCQMVNIDQATGLREKHNQPLATLASYRRSKGKITFGILLVQDKLDLENSGHKLPNELETEYTKWLRARYVRLLTVGSNLNIRRRV